MGNCLTSLICWLMCGFRDALNTFGNRADPYQAALIRAARSGPALFAFVNMIREYSGSVV